MRAIIKPKGMVAYPLKVSPDPPPSLSWDEWGASRATLTVDMDAHDRLKAPGASISVEGAAGRIWSGIVTSVKGNEITATGVQDLLDGKPRASLYAWADMSSWRSRSNMNPQPSVSTGFDSLDVKFAPDSGYVFDGLSEGSNPAIEIAFPQTIQNDVVLSGYITRSAPDAVVIAMPASFNTAASWGNKFYSQGLLGQELPGVGTTTKHAFSVTLTGPIDGISIFMTMEQPMIPAVISFQELRVVGEILDVPSRATCTAQNVLKPIFARLGIKADITDTTLIDPFAQADTSSTDRDRVKQVLELTGKQLLLRERVDGLTACYEDVPTEPSYRAVKAECDLSRPALSELVSALQVTYTDEAGVPRVIEVLDTDTSHYLVQRSLVRWGRLTVNTMSAATAAAAATSYFGKLHNRGVSGTVTVRGEVDGVPVSAIEVGRVINVTDPELGAVNALITGKDLTGEAVCRLTVGEVASVADLVARAVERKKRNLG